MSRALAGFALLALSSCAPEPRAVEAVPQAPPPASGDVVALPPLAPRDAAPAGAAEPSVTFDPYAGFGSSVEKDADGAKAWSDAQDHFARGLLDRLPAREEILKRLVETNTPVGWLWGGVAGSTRFYVRYYSRHGVDVAHLLVSIDDAPPRELATLPYSIRSLVPSPHGKYVAVQYADDLGKPELRVFDAQSGAVLETLGRVQYDTVAWLPDDTGFVFRREFIAAGVPPTLVRHVVGSPDADRAVFGGGSPVERFVADWSSTLALQHAVGPRTLTVLVHGTRVEKRARKPGDKDDAPPTQTVTVRTIYVAPLASLTSAVPHFRVLEHALDGVQLGNDDDVFLVTPGAEKVTTWSRLDVAQAGSTPTVVVSSLTLLHSVQESKDSFYYIRPMVELPGTVGTLMRRPRAGGDEEPVHAGAFVRGYAASPREPGIVARLVDPLAAGVYSVVPGAPPSLWTTDAHPYDPSGLRVARVGQDVKVVHAQGLRPDRERPAILLFADDVTHPETHAWLERGGVVALCKLPEEQQGGTVNVRRELEGLARQFAHCADDLAGSSWTRRERIGAVCRAAICRAVLAAALRDASAFAAFVFEDPWVDLPSPAVPSTHDTAPYRSLDHAALGPMLVASRHRPSRSHAARLAARLAASRPDRIAVWFVDRDPKPDVPAPSDMPTESFLELAREADEEAFLLLYLAGQGRDRMPRFERR